MCVGVCAVRACTSVSACAPICFRVRAFGMHSVSVRERACMCACARSGVRVHMHVCVRVRVYVAFVCGYVRACVRPC
jgi:hypothetical protein